MSVGSRNRRIDTLRGVSIVLVLLHHFNIAYRMNDTILARLMGWTTLHALVRNGNYAVTMFFVISGFLITARADRRWGGLSRIDPSVFYRARAARIVPCLLLCVAGVNVLAALGIGIFQNHPEFGGPVSFWRADLASLTFWMNVLMSSAGWFNYVLCVQWSLSIEEVFYLAFPILCLLLRRETHLVAAWCLFIVIGPIWRATHLASEYQELNSYLSCFDGIAFGCCAAILCKHVRLPAWSVRPSRIALAAGLCGFYLAAPISDSAIYGVTLMALGTALLLFVQASAKPTQPGIALAPLRFYGRLSYEFYLFHLFVLGALSSIWPADMMTGNDIMLLLVAYLALSTVLAFVVSRYFAEPLNRRLRAAASRSARLQEA